MPAKYDQTSAESIKAFALLLLHKKLVDFGITEAMAEEMRGGKGIFGKIVEKKYFEINPGNEPCIPDFPEAEVELKSTKLIKKSDGTYGAGERLKLSSLNFTDILDDDWLDTCILKKNKRMLLIGHVFEKGIHAVNELIELVDEWQIPEEDLLIMRADWKKIRDCVVEKRLLELSESLTDYLGAATAGQGGQGDDPEKPRALVFKQAYVNAIVRRLLYGKDYQWESIIKHKRIKKAQSIESFVPEAFEQFLGLSLDELMEKFNVTANPKRKDYYSYVSRAVARSILGVKEDKPIEEFEKAGIIMKTIRLEQDGIPEQHLMLRPAFKYTEIIKESWEDSEFRQVLSKKFFFVVFKKDDKGVLRLAKVFFWRMLPGDMEGNGKWCWEETKKRILAGDSDKLPKVTENPMCHVRPMASNALDTYDTPQGDQEVKKGFWLRNTYIARIISTHQE